MFNPQPRVPPAIQQLPLPLTNLKQSSPLLPSEPHPLPAHQVWADMSPTTQAQARREILRILREVFHESTVR